jgi:hypothetical protein
VLFFLSRPAQRAPVIPKSLIYSTICLVGSAAADVPATITTNFKRYSDTTESSCPALSRASTSNLQAKPTSAWFYLNNISLERARSLSAPRSLER